jgi:hypothetical protein
VLLISPSRTRRGSGDGLAMPGFGLLALKADKVDWSCGKTEARVRRVFTNLL